MAQRKRRAKKKSNPASSNGLLLLGGVAVAGYFAYVNGWFSSLPSFAAAPPVTSTGTNNPVTNPNTSIINAPSAPPPLGTVVKNGNDITAQALAGYAYILPGPGIDTSIAPNGYSRIVTQDYGPIYLRNNVYSAVNTTIANRMNRATAAGASATSLQNAGIETLPMIQTVMSTEGLTGLGGMRGGW